MPLEPLKMQNLPCHSPTPSPGMSLLHSKPKSQPVRTARKLPRRCSRTAPKGKVRYVVFPGIFLILPPDFFPSTSNIVSSRASGDFESICLGMAQGRHAEKTPAPSFWVRVFRWQKERRRGEWELCYKGRTLIAVFLTLAPRAGDSRTLCFSFLIYHAPEPGTLGK